MVVVSVQNPIATFVELNQRILLSVGNASNVQRGVSWSSEPWKDDTSSGGGIAVVVVVESTGNAPPPFASSPLMEARAEVSSSMPSRGEGRAGEVLNVSIDNRNAYVGGWEGAEREPCSTSPVIEGVDGPDGPCTTIAVSILMSGIDR